MLQFVPKPAFCIHTAIALPLGSMVTAGATASPTLDSIGCTPPQEFEFTVYRFAKMCPDSAHTATASPAGSMATFAEVMERDNPADICSGLPHTRTAPKYWAAQTLSCPLTPIPYCCRHTAIG